jgi:hypothetical protein
VHNNDALIAEKERMLSLLEEKRTALISHGLNLDSRLFRSSLMRATISD